MNSVSQGVPGAPSGTSYRWVALVACFLACGFSYGILYTFGVYLTPIQEDLGWSRSMVSWVAGLQMAVVCVAGCIGGWLADRWPRAVALFGAVLMGMGLMLASRVSTPWHLYVYYSLLVGTGIGFAAAPLMPVAMRWFPKKTGFAVSVVAMGSSLGVMAIAPLAARAIDAYGWRTSCFLFGFGALLVIGAALLMKGAPAGKSETANVEHSTAHLEGLSISQALRTRSLWMLFAIFGLAYAGLMMVMYHLAAHATELGHPAMLGAALLSALSIGGIIGKFVGAAASDRMPKKVLLALMLAFQVVAMVLLTRATSAWMLYTFAIVFGICEGVWGPMIASVTGETFGLRYVAGLIGVVAVSYGIGGTIGPTLAGYIFSDSGSYNMAFYIGAAGLALASALCFFMKPATKAAPSASRPKEAYRVALAREDGSQLAHKEPGG